VVACERDSNLPIP